MSSFRSDNYCHVSSFNSRFDNFAGGIYVTRSVNAIEFMTVMRRVPHGVDQTEFREVVVLELVEVAGDNGEVVGSEIVDFVEGSPDIVDLFVIGVCASG